MTKMSRHPQSNTIHASNLRLMFNISQGQVPTHLTCGGTIESLISTLLQFPGKCASEKKFLNQSIFSEDMDKS